MIIVPTSWWPLIKTLQGTCSAMPAQSQCLLNARLSYYQFTLVTHPLKPSIAPHCLQDRLHTPQCSYMSKSLTLSSPSWVWAELNILTMPGKAWPFLPGFRIALSWEAQMNTAMKKMKHFLGGPNPLSTPAFSCERSTKSTSGCLPDSLCLGHPVVTVEPHIVDPS